MSRLLLRCLVAQPDVTWASATEDNLSATGRSFVSMPRALRNTYIQNDAIDKTRTVAKVKLTRCH